MKGLLIFTKYTITDVYPVHCKISAIVYQNAVYQVQIMHKYCIVGKFKYDKISRMVFTCVCNVTLVLLRELIIIRMMAILFSISILSA